MLNDILTICWKEWKEILLQHSGLKTGLVASIIIPMGLLGIFMPLSEGERWVRSSMAPVLWVWLPVFLVATMICDSFAGERERHTLETLLASRLSDRAILFGKIAAAVAYGWGLALASLALGLITVNVVHGHGRFLMFKADVVWAITSLSLLGSGLASAGGVLISLRAKTVRQAQQTLSLALMALIFGGFGLSKIPAVQTSVMQFFTARTAIYTELAIGAILLGIDAALIAAAMARFQRTRLVLD